MTKLISKLFETMCREQCLAKAGLRHLKLVSTKIVVGLSKDPLRWSESDHLPVYLCNGLKAFGRFNKSISPMCLIFIFFIF